MPLQGALPNGLRVAVVTRQRRRLPLGPGTTAGLESCLLTRRRLGPRVHVRSRSLDNLGRLTRGCLVSRGCRDCWEVHASGNSWSQSVQPRRLSRDAPGVRPKERHQARGRLATRSATSVSWRGPFAEVEMSPRREGQPQPTTAEEPLAPQVETLEAMPRIGSQDRRKSEIEALFVVEGSRGQQG